MIEDEDYDALSQKHLASLKRDTRVSFEDATVRATHKVMAEATGWDNGLSQDYDKKLGAWFSEKPNAKEELRARTFCSRCGKRLGTEADVHTCTPPQSFRESVCRQMGIPMTPRTYDDYGNKIV